MLDLASSVIRQPPYTLSSGWGHLVLLGVSAVLVGLAYPYPGWWWCAYVGLVPAAMVAIGSGSGWQLLLSSFTVAWAWWLLRIQWLATVTGGGYVALAGFMALYSPMAWILLRMLYRQYPRLPVAVSLPLVWVSLEFVRGSVPAGGFEWFLLAHSQAPYAEGQEPGRIVQVADLFGEHTVSFLVAMANGLVVDIIVGFMAVAKANGYERADQRVLSIVVSIPLLIGAGVYGQYRIGQSSASHTSRYYTLAVIQTNVPQDNKDRPTPQQEEDQWQRLITLTRQAAASNEVPALIVWPETIVPAPLNPQATAYFRNSAHNNPQAAHALRYTEKIAQLARRLNIDLIVGAAAYEWSPKPGRYNAAYLYNSNGLQFPERYDKIHRVPFGEYLPWVDSWPWLKEIFLKYLSPYETDYTLQPGESRVVFDLQSRMSLLTHSNSARPRTVNPNPSSMGPSKVRIATPICFEDVVAELCREMVYEQDGSKRADLLVNLTNDGWYSGSHLRPQHFQVAVLRCIENRVPMARSVNTGVSGFIDSLGRVGPLVSVDGRSQRVEGFAVHSVQLDSRQTLWGSVGRWPVFIMMIVTSGLVATAALRRHDPEISALRLE